jgi:hypothetical protein
MARGDNPNSRANLRPARRGEVRNPEGRNRRRPISDRYFELCEEEMPLVMIRRFNRKWKGTLLYPGDTWARGAAMRTMCEAAFAGQVRAAKEMREGIEGKAPQRLEIATRPRTEIILRVVNDRTRHRTDRKAAPYTIGGAEAERVLSKMPVLTEIPGLPS